MPFVKQHRDYYKWGTEPNANIVGGVSITDGIADGFYKGSYLQLPKPFDVSSSDNWEMLFKVKTGEYLANSDPVCIPYKDNTYCVIIRYLGGKWRIGLSSDGSSSDIGSEIGTHSVLKETDYWLKLVFDGSSYVFSYSLDGVDYIEDAVVESSTKVYSGALLTLGSTGKESSERPVCWRGTMDLNQSYIKIDGDYWWHGTKAVESTKDDYDYYETRNKFHQLVKPKRFYYDYSNEANVNIVGNRSIVLDGIASNFKAASYLLLPNTFDVADGKSWEIVVCVETGSDVTSEQSITGTNYYRYDPITLTVKSSRFYMNLCSGTSTTLIEAAKGTYAVQPNTRYWLKATFDGANYTLDYSLDGVDFVNDITKASTKYIHSKPLILGCQAASENGTVKVPWLGSVDLNETYVNINGERWWDISKGYTRNGFWIDEGVASGWGGSIYLTAPFNIDIASGKEWEIVFKFKTGTNITTNQTVFSIPNWSLAFNIENSKTSFYLSSNGTSWNMASALAGTTTLETETWYYGKIVFNGNKYVLALSKDGIDWTEESVLESTTPINNASQIFTIGRYNSNIAFANTGLIDLNECYVKINNRLWWHGTKIVEGDKDNYAFYEDRLLSYAPILNNKLY